MKKFMAVVIFLLSISSAGAVTWSYTGANYLAQNITNFTNNPCSAGVCASFTPAMKISGSFTVSGSSLPANLTLSEIGPTVTAYSFSDGVNTYSSTDTASSRMDRFMVTTDNNGALTAVLIQLQVWKTGTQPHSGTNRFSWMRISTSLNTDNFYHNNGCSSVGQSTAGSVDACLQNGLDGNSSSGGSLLGVWTLGAITPPVSATPTSIPTLSDWGVLLLASLMVLFGIWHTRRSAI